MVLLQLDMIDLHTAGLTLVVAFLIQQAIVILYNVYFHPLKVYPGPRLLAASRIPNAYATITGQFPFWIHRHHEKYGTIVRVGPNELSYTDPQAWKDIYGSTPSRPQGMPRDSEVFQNAEDDDNRPSILTCGDSDHARLRRAYFPAFSKKALADQEPLFVRYCDLLISKLWDMREEVVDLGEMFHFSTFDMTGHLQYGESLRILEGGPLRSWAHSQLWVARLATILSALADFVPIRLLLRFVLTPLSRPARQAYYRFSNKMIDHRLSLKTNEPDLVGLAFQSSRRTGLTERDIRANAPVIMTAGSETSPSALAALTACLLQHPQILEQVTREIRTRFRDMSEISSGSVARLPFLNACISEALRMYPPICGAFPRLVPHPGARIAGRWVPGGTRVSAASFAMTHSPLNFRDPDAFLPQRWMKESDSLFAEDNTAASQPFSVGPRNCIGMDMAWLNLRMTMCKLLFTFDIHPSSDVDLWLSKRRVWTTWHADPLFVRLTPQRELDVSLQCEQ